MSEEKAAKKTLTTQELAKALKISDARVRKLRIEERLPGAEEVGGTWVYPAELIKIGYAKKKVGRPAKK